MKRLSIILLFLFAIALQSCEDVVQADIAGSRPTLCVDAFITNDTLPQKIKLTLTAPYLGNTAAGAATGAKITMTDIAERVFEFTDPDNDGVYICNQPVRTSDPRTWFPIGVPGNFYRLEIKYANETYESFAKMDSVPPIDSLGYEFEEQRIRGNDTLPSGYELTMVARDIAGQQNAYWFKSYRNGVLFNKPNDLNLALNAAYSEGSDGVQFIAPIIFNLSPERFQPGDIATVEIHSIGVPTYVFLNLAQNQMTNGGLFASPVVNCPTNIINKDAKSKTQVVGWFCAASIYRKSVTIKN